MRIPPARTRAVILGACVLLGAFALFAMLPRRAPTPTTERPAVPRVPEVRTDDPIRGPMNAPLTIFEFSDFTCPACAEVQPMLNTLRAEYGTRLRIVWKDIPHRSPSARTLHIAAACAGEQGKFWEFHDALFAQQGNRVTPDTIARTLRLDLDAFTVCRTSVAHAERMDAALTEAALLRIRGTPTFFIGSERLEGAIAASRFRNLLDRTPSP